MSVPIRRQCDAKLFTSGLGIGQFPFPLSPQVSVALVDRRQSVARYVDRAEMGTKLGSVGGWVLV
jgi:hypothetical protein